MNHNLRCELARLIAFFSLIEVICFAVAKKSFAVEFRPCNAKVVNKISGCLSKKEEYFSTRKIAVLSAAVTPKRSRDHVTQLRKNFANYLQENFDELLELATHDGQIEWAERWKSDTKDDRASEAAKELKKVRDLKEKGITIHGWTDHPNTPKYPPRIKEVDGKFYDIANIADVDIRLLPQKFKNNNIESSKIVLREAVKQLKSGRPLSKSWWIQVGNKIHIAWLENNPWDKKDPIKGKSFKEMQDLAQNSSDKSIRDRAQAMIDLDTDRISSTFKSVQRHIRSKGIGSISGMTLAQKIGKKQISKHGLFILGPVFGALGEVSEIGGDTPFDPQTCMKKSFKGSVIDPESGLRVRDLINAKFARNCFQKSPHLKIDPRVEQMLMLSDREKDQFMKNPKVCQFYNDLAKRTCEQYILKQYSCSRNSKSPPYASIINSDTGITFKVELISNSQGLSEIKGPMKMGFRKSGEDNWSPYFVPHTRHGGNTWVTGGRGGMGFRSNSWEEFENDEALGIGALLPKLEAIAKTCTHPNKEVPDSFFKNGYTPRKSDMDI